MTEIKINSTLCYIEKDGCYLMLYRNKKPDDPSEGKWVGVGGKFEPGETADECLLREVREETGLKLKEYRFRGIINFVSDRWPDEDMYLYSASDYEGSDNFPKAEFASDTDSSDSMYRGRGMTSSFECSEGDLYWIPKEKILDLNLWEGDRYFLEPMIAGKEKIYLTCRYAGHKCVEVRNEEVYN